MALRVAAEAMTTVSAVMESNCPCVADLSNDEVEVLIDAASDALAIGTGNVVEGRRTITVLPIADYGCDPDPTVDGIPLGGHDPRVVSVTINGTVLDPSSYRFAVMQDGLPLLVRVATDAPPPPWPRSQALWRQGVGPNTFAITYTYGVHVDWMVSEAAIE